MRWKFHISVIGVISVALLGSYLLFKAASPPPAVQATAAQQRTQLRIQSASWGLNCNSLYEIYKQHAASETGTDPDSPSAKAPPVRIPADNVLEKVRAMCDAKQACTLTANTETMGEVFADCSKDLDVSWRCFNYDKLHSKHVHHGGTIEIDCSNT